MREFRGKRIDGSKNWAYGNLILSKANAYIINADNVRIGENNTISNTSAQPVIPDTVGQFTGLHDKNGKSAYEGDKLLDEDDPNGYFLIEWNDKEAMFEINSYGHAMYHNEGGGEEYSNGITCVDKNLYDLSMLDEFEIIGNIHNNNKQ